VAAKKKSTSTAKKKVTRMKAGTAKKVDENTVGVNLKGIEGRRVRRVRIKEGNYLAKVTSAKAETSGSGNDMIVWEFDIVDHPKYEGARFWYNTVLLPQSLWNLRAVLDALGVKVKDTTMNIPLGRLIDRTCGIEIVDGEYEGKTRSEINDIFPEALLEENDEEEEEEEEEEEDEEENEEEDEEEDDEEEDDEEENEEDDDWDIDLDEED